METKVCTLCKKEKLIEEFARKRNKRQSRCKSCFNQYTRAHYKNNKDYYKEKAERFNKQRKPETLQFVMDFLKVHPCVDCGETDPVVLEFDHVRGKKKAAISSMIQHCSPIDSIQIEIQKCEVRCCNCHRRKTAKQFGWYRDIQL